MDAMKILASKRLASDGYDDTLPLGLSESMSSCLKWGL